MAYGTAGLMLRLQGFSNNPFLLITISLGFILMMSSHLSLGLPKVLFPVGVPVKILKKFLPSSILAT